MNADPNPPSDLQDAVIAWQGGQLPNGRAEALLQKLQADAAFRAALTEQVWTLSLARVAQAPDPRWLALSEEIGLDAARKSAASAHGMEGALMGMIRSEPLRFVAAWWRWVATGAVAALIILSAMLLLRESVPVSKFQAPTLAILVPGEKAVWQGMPLPLSPGSSAVSAGRLQLAAGQARLLFINGVTLDFEGPADLHLVSVQRVICHEGRLRTNVPPGAEGFCVETPRGAVTDLGTELGISVSREGETNVAVFEGQAEVSVQIPGGAGVRTALLNQSDKAELEPGKGEIRSGSQHSFLTAVSPKFPALRLAANYAQQVMAAKPAHYWRLDRAQDNAIPNEVSGGQLLRLAGGAHLEPDMQGRANVVFRGKRQPGALYAETPWITPAAGYAVEFWFVADTLDQMALAALTTTAATSPHVALVEVGGRRAGHDFSAGIVRYLLRWPPGPRDGMNLYSPPVALPYQWHHVVAQHQQGRLQLFLNGLEIGSTQADAAPSAVQCVLQFGCLEYTEGVDPAKLRRPFSGRMAEIAVYDRLLTADEIRSHAAAAGR